MRHWFCGIILATLAGCGGRDLAAVDLAPMLPSPRLLPSGLSPQSPTNIPHSFFFNAPMATKVIDQRFGAGGVTIALYEDDNRQNQAFATIKEALGGKREDTTIGETRLISSHSEEQDTFADILFVRCSAVVFIRVPIRYKDDIFGIGEAIDSNLQNSVVCK